jgi:hypothetical protein
MEKTIGEANQFVSVLAEQKTLAKL